MAKSSVLLNLPQLVDVALNCQEGVINFQALHTLLHVLIQQMALGDIGVEFRGDDSEKIQSFIKCMKPSTNIYPEYSIVGQRGKKSKITGSKKISLQDVIREKSEEIKLKEKEIRTIDRRKDSKEDPDSNPLPLKSPQGSLLGFKANDVKTVVVVESQSTLPQFTVAISKDAFNLLQDDLQSVKEQMKELKELPGNMGLLEAARSPSGPILDMFQILNLTKRTESNEEAIIKISSLIEDLAKMGTDEVSPSLEEKLQDMKETVEVASSGSPKHSIQGDKRVSIDSQKRQGSLTKSDLRVDKKSIARITTLEHRVSDLEVQVKDIIERELEFNTAQEEEGVEIKDKKVEKDEEGGKNEKVEKDEDEDNEDEEDKEAAGIKSEKKKSVSTPQSVDQPKTIEAPPKKKPPRRFSKSDSVKVLTPHSPFHSVVSSVDLTDLSTEDALALIQQEFQNLQKWTTENIQEMDKKIFQPGALCNIDTKSIEDKFKEYADKIKQMNMVYDQQIAVLNNHYERVQADMDDIYTKLEIVLPGGDSTGITAETTMELANKLALLEQEMIVITDNTAKLEEEKKERDKQTEAILEQIDVLKIVKANREDLEDALGEKADACMINRKVSHDQFDAACDDLTRGIEEALSKLEEQEDLWRQALDSLHKEVGNKLDKMEVDPLRDFVNSKLKALQDKFKALTNLKKEHEAAGAKSKFLRDVNCISCDRDVVMRKEMDMSLKPNAYAMPPRRNMAPYLAYELDQLRKQQKCVPGSKNLNFIESAIKTRGQKQKDHICNRYCGGSHTTTTPQQRVTRLGHFLDQWGPEIAPLNEEYVKGSDNHMYRARDGNQYKKIKQSQTKAGGKTNKEIPTPESEIPQHDRETYINPMAEDIISMQDKREQAEQTDDSNQKKKQYNIGAMAITRGSRKDAENGPTQESDGNSLNVQN